MEHKKVLTLGDDRSAKELKMLRQPSWRKMVIPIVVLALILCLAPNCAGPAWRAQPSPTPIPAPLVPERAPLSIAAWGRDIALDTICLKTDFSLYDHFLTDKYRVEGQFYDPIDDLIRTTLTNMGMRIVDQEGPCDAALVTVTSVRAGSASYGGSLKCYTWGAIRSTISLSIEGQRTISHEIRASEDPPSVVPFEACRRAEQPEDYIEAARSLWFEPLIDFLVDLWGPRAAVHSLAQYYDRRMPRTEALVMLQAIGPTDEVLLELIHLYLRADKSLHEEAAWMIRDLQPIEADWMVYLLLQHLAENHDADTLALLGSFESRAIIAVPAMIEEMEGANFKDAYQVLKRITGEDLGESPSSWKSWWDKGH